MARAMARALVEESRMEPVREVGMRMECLKVQIVFVKFSRLPSADSRPSSVQRLNLQIGSPTSQSAD